MLIVFDVNETLLDLRALDEPFARLTGSATACAEWFDLAIHTVLTVTAAGGYRNFFEILGDSADAVAEEHGRPLSAPDRDAVLTGVRRMPVHPDVPAGLARLRAAGHRLVALTNGPLAGAHAQLDNAGLTSEFDRIFSAEQAGVLKPAAPAYRQVTSAYRVKPVDATMVAAHGWDVAGAQAAGLRGAFLARPGRRPLPGVPRPDWSAPDLVALAARLGPARAD